MVADSVRDEEKPDVEESYSAAAGTSNLRVESHRRTPADMIIAAGMNSHRMGLALMRLRTEWDNAAKPPVPAAEQIEQLARSMKVEPAKIEAEVDGEPQQVANPYGGLVREEFEDEVRYRLPLVVAREQAQAWHEHELGLLLQQLKSLPSVRDGLTAWTLAEGYEEGVHLVAAVLLWWLHPKCYACQGTGKKVIAGTGGRSAGKVCGECRKHLVLGERNVPHGGRGRKLLSYINECRRGARIGLENKFRHQRPKK